MQFQREEEKAKRKCHWLEKPVAIEMPNPRKPRCLAYPSACSVSNNWILDS